MRKVIEYASKPACPKGNVDWLKWENNVWSQLVKRQNKITETRACKEILKGRKMFNFGDKIPQIPYLNDIIYRETGWVLEPVPAKISLEHFFGLLSEKVYPCITFIRVPEEMEYASAADVFHEIYGHCPMLTDPQFAHYVHTYGKLGAKSNSEQRKFLMRLYMFTAEFGLVKQNNKTKIMGAGIMSSIEEAAHSIDNPEVVRKPLDVLQALRTPYTLDDMQYLYYVADGVEQLYNMDQSYIMDKVAQAKELGMLEPHRPLENYFAKKQNENDENQGEENYQQQQIQLQPAIL